jgi:phage terminase large subunit GpA-like protein
MTPATIEAPTGLLPEAWSSDPSPVKYDVKSARIRARREGQRILRQRFRPPPRLSVSEWSDAHRILPETSAEPGRWRTSRAPYLREIMDSCSDHGVERVVFMKSSQVGYSEALLNILGYFVDQDPAPILVVQISIGEAAKFSKERVAPLIQDCPVLREKVVARKSRDSGNTIDAKKFRGGHLGIVGANAPSGLRARARRVILFDEVDGFPASAGEEGDPIELAEKRSTTFWNRLIVMGSTPTIKDLSRIEAAFLESDQRYYLVPCPDCGHEQRLIWERVVWEKEELPEGGKRHRPETAAYCCEACGSLIRERSKPRMLRDGRWVATEESEIRGYHISSLYSPWLTWAELAREFLKAVGSKERLQVFTNTRLGLPWDAAGEVFDDQELLRRREVYVSSPLPAGAVLLTAGVDVQADRLEVEVVGWGRSFESWSIEYRRIPGDPSGPGPWKLLDELMAETWKHPSGTLLRISAMAVDSGYLTQQVYRYAKKRFAQRVWAVKGRAGEGLPIMGRPTAKNKAKVPLYPIGVDTAKGQLYRWLQVEPGEPGEPNPGYCHFPSREPYDEEYFRQLTGEKLVTRVNRVGRMKREWVRRPGRRVEALDVRVYAMAAAEGLVAAGVNLEKLADLMKVVEAAPAPPRSRIRSKGVDG